MTDFKNIEYLKSGNPRQIKTYDTLTKLNIFKKLKAFNPILVGTIPIEIDIEESDLDIICHCNNHSKFLDLLTKTYGNEENFTTKIKSIGGIKSVICRFESNGFEIEIFAQNIPTEEQNAYKHMIIEHKILKEKGDEFKEKIIKLKKAGLKTEPAFAKLLGIVGDPYMQLLKI